MTPSLTETQFETLLRAFVAQILPGLEMTVGQLNRVGEPTPDNYVIVWPILRKRLSTTAVTWDESAMGNPSVQDNTECLRIDMQMDFHGADSTDNGQVFATLFRSGFACDYFQGTGFQPNYCTDGAQMAFIDGSDQFQDRWTLSAVFDANITVSTPQQFANKVTVDLEAVISST